MDQHAGGSALRIMTGEGSGEEGRGGEGRKEGQAEREVVLQCSLSEGLGHPPSSAPSSTEIRVRVPGLSTLCRSVPGRGVSQEGSMTLGETAVFNQLRAV